VEAEVPMQTLAFLGSLGASELLIVLAIIVLLFGARKIPDLARGLGEGIRNFKQGIRDEEGSSKTDKKNLPGDGEEKP
jgi:sec-independent protein translocase protein TatA